MAKNWLIAPEIFDKLNKEFNFDFDPCPYPKPEWNGLKIEWGSSNWVNPPFRKEDGGPIYPWVKKAIEEYKKGKTSVLILQGDFWLAPLIDQKVEIRNLGTIEWINAENGERNKSSRAALLFILRANKEQQTHE